MTGETSQDTAATAAAEAAVVAAGQAASAAAGELRQLSAGGLDEALRAIAARLTERAQAVLAANAQDVRAAQADGLAGAFVDRLALSDDRLRAMSEQLLALAQIPAQPDSIHVRDLPDGLELRERQRPVGVVGANFEARPNVVVDIASQLIKSRNAGVLRTGSSAIRSAAVLVDEVVWPAMKDSGLDPAAIQLLRIPGRESAFALVRQPRLIPLVILRGSGDSTRALARQAALHGVRTLAHADGGAVLYLDRSADMTLAARIIEASLDRLGVCNRLNLLLVDRAIWDAALPAITAATQRLGIALSLPPHRHPLGHEWALDSGAEATITVALADGAAEAAEIANRETSGLAAGIVATDAGAAQRFLDGYAGTGAFWNATTRLLDGFKLLSLPETGINIDVVPGPRGPVTFRDLCLRQYVVVPRPGGQG
ncbi:MAG TPA: aldehyde dehydrogenase family protein [Streptosporangiaceae bacterium]|nr:aldehyde dehydrogenase family protein [Streptosporangiaceae bacterium]